MKRLFIILPILVVLFTSCDKNNELDESVFIHDDDDPELPIYSEWGYNTFGNYFDRDVFISDEDDIPFKVRVDNNGFAFYFDGQLIPDYDDDCDCDDDDDRKTEDMRMVFIISDFKPDDYKDLLVLHDTLFDLTDDNCKVFLSTGFIDDTLEIMSGELYFKRAQNLIVDKVEEEVILSGTYEFKAIIDGEPVTIKDGRFDAGIGDDVFYSELK